MRVIHISAAQAQHVSESQGFDTQMNFKQSQLSPAQVMSCHVAHCDWCIHCLSCKCLLCGLCVYYTCRADVVFQLLHLSVAVLFAEQLQKNLEALKMGKKSDVSLAAKWAPTPARKQQSGKPMHTPSLHLLGILTLYYSCWPS